MESSATLLNLNITIQNSWLNCWLKIDVQLFYSAFLCFIVKVKNFKPFNFLYLNCFYPLFFCVWKLVSSLLVYRNSLFVYYIEQTLSTLSIILMTNIFPVCYLPLNFDFLLHKYFNIIKFIAIFLCNFPLI